MSAVRTPDNLMQYDSYEIVIQALDYLGISMESLFKVIGMMLVNPKAQLKAENISATHWFAICKILYISTDTIYFGYKKDEHFNCMYFCFREGTLDLPKTKKCSEILKQIKKEEYKDFLSNNRYYTISAKFKRFTGFKKKQFEKIVFENPKSVWL